MRFCIYMCCVNFLRTYCAVPLFYFHLPCCAVILFSLTCCACKIFFSHLLTTLLCIYPRFTLTTYPAVSANFFSHSLLCPYFFCRTPCCALNFALRLPLTLLCPQKIFFSNLNCCVRIPLLRFPLLLCLYFSAHTPCCALIFFFSDLTLSRPSP